MLLHGRHERCVAVIACVGCGRCGVWGAFSQVVMSSCGSVVGCGLWVCAVCAMPSVPSVRLRLRACGGADGGRTPDFAFRFRELEQQIAAEIAIEIYLGI